MLTSHRAGSRTPASRTRVRASSSGHASTCRCFVGSASEFARRASARGTADRHVPPRRGEDGRPRRGAARRRRGARAHRQSGHDRRSRRGVARPRSGHPRARPEVRHDGRAPRARRARPRIEPRPPPRQRRRPDRRDGRSGGHARRRRHGGDDVGPPPAPRGARGQGRLPRDRDQRQPDQAPLRERARDRAGGRRRLPARDEQPRRREDLRGRRVRIVRPQPRADAAQPRCERYRRRARPGARARGGVRGDARGADRAGGGASQTP